MIRERSNLIAQTILFLDLISMCLSFFLAYFLFPVYQPLFTGEERRALFPFHDYLWLLVAFMLLWPVLIYGEIHNELSEESYLRIAQRVAKAASLGFAIIVFLVFIMKAQWISRLFVASFGVITIGLLILERSIVKFYFGRIHWCRSRRKRVLIIGSKRRAEDAIRRATKTRECEILGCFDPDPARVGLSVRGVEVLGTIGQLASFILKHSVDEVVIAMPLASVAEGEGILSLAEKIGMRVRIMPDFQVDQYPMGNSTRKVHLEEFCGIPVLTLFATRGTMKQLLGKRIVDIVGAIVLLVACLPLFLIIAALLKLTSRGPVFYRWRVMGKNNREFVGYKFRSMVEGAEKLKVALLSRNEMTGPAFKITEDPRVTRVGRFLRKYSLDELPQLYSVLKGDMSLVGPRPPFREELERFEFWQRRKLSVKPGLTCLWQISGRNSINDFSEWAKMDLEYIDNWSPMLDFKILAKTVLVVLKGTGR